MKGASCATSRVKRDAHRRRIVGWHRTDLLHCVRVTPRKRRDYVDAFAKRDTCRSAIFLNSGVAMFRLKYSHFLAERG
jgi:hypothetical protein